MSDGCYNDAMNPVGYNKAILESTDSEDWLTDEPCSCVSFSATGGDDSKTSITYHFDKEATVYGIAITPYWNLATFSYGDNWDAYAAMDNFMGAKVYAGDAVCETIDSYLGPGEQIIINCMFANQGMSASSITIEKSDADFTLCGIEFYAVRSVSETYEMLSAAQEELD